MLIGDLWEKGSRSGSVYQNNDLQTISGYAATSYAAYWEVCVYSFFGILFLKTSILMLIAACAAGESMSQSFAYGVYEQYNGKRLIMKMWKY